MSSALEAAWATDERPTESPSMSQDELIAEFHKLDALVKEHGARRAEIGAAVASIARSNKGTQNTVHLQSTAGQKLKVQFNNETIYITDELMEVSAILGADVFDSLFKTKIEFTAQKKNLNNFFNTVHPDERVQTAKQMIKDATITKEKTPYVSVE